MVKPVYNNPKSLIESYEKSLQGELALLIFLFSMNQLDWKDKSIEEYWENSSTYNPRTKAYIYKKDLTSDPFNLNLFVIESIKQNPKKWAEESCLIWDYNIKASK